MNQNREDTKPCKNVQSQQFYPGGPPRRPGMENQPRTAPPGMPPQFPGMEGQPRTAPPNFIPEQPGMERRPMSGPDQFGSQYRQDRQRDIRGCINRFTFIWLINGNSFWFYPTFVDRQFVHGFRWRRNRWEFDRINRRRIAFFRCF